MTTPLSLPNGLQTDVPQYNTGVNSANIRVTSFFVAIADDDILVAPISAIRLYEAWLRRKK
jgi:hypothetical protein